jgi:hypothetical protein
MSEKSVTISPKLRLTKETVKALALKTGVRAGYGCSIINEICVHTQ